MRGRAAIFTLVLALSAGQPVYANDDAFVIIVAADSPVERIKAHELTDLYLGRTGRFPDGRRAVPVDRENGSAAKSAFYETLLRQNPIQVRAHWYRLVFTGRGRPPRQATDGHETIEIVARDPHAIAYVEPQLVDDSVRIVNVEP